MILKVVPVALKDIELNVEPYPSSINPSFGANVTPSIVPLDAPMFNISYPSAPDVVEPVVVLVVISVLLIEPVPGLVGSGLESLTRTRAPVESTV